MPAACSLSGRLSTRNASTTISCVDDVAATSSAPSATNSGERAGSVSASSRIATISSSCENTSQPRRRPNRAREQRHMQRIDQRRPDKFQRVGRADQREQADGAEVDAGFAHPHQQRRSRQRQRQARRKSRAARRSAPAVADRRQGYRGSWRGASGDGWLGRLSGRGHASAADSCLAPCGRVDQIRRCNENERICHRPGHRSIRRRHHRPRSDDREVPQAG